MQRAINQGVHNTMRAWGVFTLGLISAVHAPGQSGWNVPVAATVSGCLAPPPGQRVIVAASLLDISPGSIAAGGDGKSLVAWLADRAPRASGQFGSLPVSGAFKTALDYHEAALPNRTPAEIQAIRRAHKTLSHRRPWILALFVGRGPATPSYKLRMYRSYARQYREAEYSVATAVSAADRAKAESQRREVEGAWKAQGFKTEIEHALDDLSMEAATDPQARWAVVSQAFSAAAQVAPDGSRYLPVTATPTYQDWLAETNWIHCASGAVSLDVKLVAIERGWLDVQLITSRSWRWLAGTPYSSTYISDGAGDSSEQTSLLSFIPEDLLLFRNLVVQVSPGVQMRMPAPRFGGWLTSETSKSPNPDPASRWPTDTQTKVPAGTREPNLANSTCMRTLSANGQLTEVVQMDGAIDGLANEDLDRFIASFPIERL